MLERRVAARDSVKSDGLEALMWSVLTRDCLQRFRLVVFDSNITFA